MVEELERGEPPAAEDGEECPQGVEESGEVEDVGPEEDPARGPGPHWETEEPLERGGPGAAPEPPGVADLGGGGEEDAGEDGEGDEGHGEGVEGGDGAEGEGAAAAEEEEEEAVEEEGGSDVRGDRGEDEGPRAAPQSAVAPAEGDDRRVLR